MKTAYQLALERMESQGIDRPDAANLSAEVRDKISEVRSKAEARLAEIEILHQKALEGPIDPVTLQQLEGEYRIDRGRIEGDRDRAIEGLRRQ